MEEERRKARKTRKRLGQLKKRLPTVFQARHLAEFFGLSCKQARRMLAYWAKTGRVRRISYGFYTVANAERCLDFAISAAATRFKAGYLAGTAAAVRAKLLQRQNYSLGLNADESIDWVLPYRVVRRFVRIAGHWFARMTQRHYVDRGIIPRRIANVIVPCASRQRCVADAAIETDCWAGTARRKKVLQSYLAVTPPSRDPCVADVMRQMLWARPDMSMRRFRMCLQNGLLCEYVMRELQFLSALDEERFGPELYRARKRQRRDRADRARRDLSRVGLMARRTRRTARVGPSCNYTVSLPSEGENGMRKAAQQSQSSSMFPSSHRPVVVHG